MLAIPGKAAPRLAGKENRAEIAGVIRAAVHEALDELSETRIEAVLADGPKAADDPEAGKQVRGVGDFMGDGAQAPIESQ